MVITFAIEHHSIVPRNDIVQILADGKVVAVIYPTEKGLKIVSAHFGEIKQNDGSESNPPIPDIAIDFDPVPYAIEGGKIKKHRS